MPSIIFVSSAICFIIYITIKSSKKKPKTGRINFKSVKTFMQSKVGQAKNKVKEEQAEAESKKKERKRLAGREISLKLNNYYETLSFDFLIFIEAAEH